MLPPVMLELVGCPPPPALAIDVLKNIIYLSILKNCEVRAMSSDTSHHPQEPGSLRQNT